MYMLFENRYMFVSFTCSKLGVYICIYIDVCIYIVDIVFTVYLFV